MHDRPDSIRSPLARARGLGASGEGPRAWMDMKITALANIPLCFWLVWSVVHLKGAAYWEFTTWLANPVNAVLMILLILSGFYHAVLGTREIVEDYIHCEWFKMLKLIGQKLFFIALGVACIFAVLKVAFATGG